MTNKLDLDGLEAMAKEHPSLIVPKAEILALISQAREAERMRGAATDLVSWFDKPMIDGRVWIIPAGERGADDAVEAARQALAPATGGGDA